MITLYMPIYNKFTITWFEVWTFYLLRMYLNHKYSKFNFMLWRNLYPSTSFQNHKLTPLHAKQNSKTPPYEPAAETISTNVAARSSSVEKLSCNEAEEGGKVEISRAEFYKRRAARIVSQRARRALLTTLPPPSSDCHALPGQPELRFPSAQKDKESMSFLRLLFDSMAMTKKT